MLVLESYLIYDVERRICYYFLNRTKVCSRKTVLITTDGRIQRKQIKRRRRSNVVNYGNANKYFYRSFDTITRQQPF